MRALVVGGHVLSIAVLFTLAKYGSSLLLSATRRAIPTVPGTVVFSSVGRSNVRDASSRPALAAASVGNGFHLPSAAGLAKSLTIGSRSGALILHAPGGRGVVSSLASLIIVRVGGRERLTETVGRRTVLGRGTMGAIRSGLKVAGSNTSGDPLFSRFVGRRGAMLASATRCLATAGVDSPVTCRGGSLLVTSATDRLIGGPVGYDVTRRALDVATGNRQIYGAPVAVGPDLGTRLRRDLPDPVRNVTFRKFRTSLFGLFDRSGSPNDGDGPSSVALCDPALSTAKVATDVL